MALTTFSMDPDTPSTAATNDSTDLYAYEYEDNICNKESIRIFGAIFTPLFFFAIVILSLFGNFLVLVILVKYENLKLLTNTLLLNLVVSDLLFTAGLPFWAFTHMHGWTFGEHACKVVNLIFNTGYYSSGFLLIAMTGHRYMAVMYPLSDIVSTAGFYSVVASVVLWVGSVLAASPNMIFTVQHDGFCGYGSSSLNLFDIYMKNVLFLLTSGVFIFCYAQVVCRLMRSNAKRRGKKTMKLIFTLVLVFYIGWAPYNVILFLKSFEYWRQEEKNADDLNWLCEHSKRLDYSLYFGRLFAFSQCCLNPVLYVFVGMKFKSHLRKMLRIFRQPKNSVIRSRQGRLTITSITSGEEVSK